MRAAGTRAGYRPSAYLRHRSVGHDRSDRAWPNPPAASIFSLAEPENASTVTSTLT